MTIEKKIASLEDELDQVLENYRKSLESVDTAAKTASDVCNAHMFDHHNPIAIICLRDRVSVGTRGERPEQTHVTSGRRDGESYRTLK